MDITLDSNVLVYAFVPPLHKNRSKREEWRVLHAKAKRLYEDIIAERHRLIIPFAVVLEVASVVSLLTGKEELGKDAAIEVEDSAMLVLFDSDLKERALDYAVKIKAGGFDNLLVITSIIYGSTLITNDRPLRDKLKPIVKEYQIDIKLFREMKLEDLEA
jgi:predicted nucleic acid-binding protein